MTIRILDILDRVKAYNPEADLDLVMRAYVYSAQVHHGQVRLSGEAYLSHPLEVAAILADLRLDETSVAAGLLHDVVEDTHATEKDIEDLFGPVMREVVSGITKISGITPRNREERQAETIRKMILAMARDLRVIFVKLADRLHNMRTIQFHDEERRLSIARETLDIYAPIASRLGIYRMKVELEDRAFMVLYPERYREIENLIATKKDEREAYISKVRAVISGKLEKAGIEGEIKGRYKHFYSIDQKMKRQGLSFEDVYDIIAFRVVLDSVSRCYEVLGLIHGTWKPIANKIKDYIANPKTNMYQSLHTTVVGPDGKRMEIQIRTKEMDDVAESGIAAHWSYKERSRPDSRTLATFAWLQNIVDHQKSVSDPAEFLENVRIELFPDEVYVFTPQGDVVALPRGATPVDFAYAVHSEVGNRCTGAKVNGRMVPLKTELNTGDAVEVLTAKNHKPSKDWLNFVKTVKARSRIRQMIKAEERERSITTGREMCEKTFRRYKIAVSTVFRSEKMPEILETFGYRNEEDLLAAVGYGKVTALAVLRKYLPKEGEGEEVKEQVSLTLPQPRKKKKSKSGVTVKGEADILVRFARCCDPVPGDPIVGYITRGQGVTVHRASCVNALKVDPMRSIEVAWETDEEAVFPVRLHVRSTDRMGLLADLTAAISQCKSNIISANTRLTSGGRWADAFFTLAVKSKQELQDVVTALRKVPQVLEVRRVVK
ncbi:MAG: bifunctional (p)ppGpp synthetase/guanosine-3',5'-bis(diphosphate) 3'-pyrophosphohydrolase [Thermodesulfobacteriota bacterium]